MVAAQGQRRGSRAGFIAAFDRFARGGTEVRRVGSFSAAALEEEKRANGQFALACSFMLGAL